jgi:hypothetical protein
MLFAQECVSENAVKGIQKSKRQKFSGEKPFGHHF